MVPPPDEQKPKGNATLALRALDQADKAAEKRRREERDRDAQQEARTDSVWQVALDQAEKRASDLQTELANVRKSTTTTLRYYQVMLAFAILCVLGLAGYKVAGNLMGFGEVSIGGDEVVIEAIPAP